ARQLALPSPERADETVVPRVFPSRNGDGTGAVRGPVDDKGLRQHLFVLDVAGPVGIVGVGERGYAQADIFIVETAVTQVFRAVALSDDGDGTEESVWCI